MKKKKKSPTAFSTELYRVQWVLDLTPDGMAFILGVNAQMYRIYLSGRFDNTYSIKKGAIMHRLANLEEIISEKIKHLERAERLWKAREAMKEPPLKRT